MNPSAIALILAAILLAGGIFSTIVKNTSRGFKETSTFTTQSKDSRSKKEELIYNAERDRKKFMEDMRQKMKDQQRRY